LRSSGSARGDGIAQYRGEPVFLPVTVPGERVRARLGARRRGGWEGFVVDRLASGSGCAAPRCRHFGACGGCALQHLDDASYRQIKLETLHTALERVGIDPDIVGPMRLVPPERRRARLGLARPRDPRLPVRVGYRERFRHDLIDLGECPVLEPAIFALIGRLRQVAHELVPPGGSAEATVTRTDSGLDLMIEAAERPDLRPCEALARFAEECDLARIVRRFGADEIVVVARSTPSRATHTPLLRSPEPPQTSRGLPSSAATWPATQFRLARSPATLPRCLIRRAPAPPHKRRRSPPRR
jgi:23S rRNA (uracil1939-C5)-methyltransferase